LIAGKGGRLAYFLTSVPLLLKRLKFGLMIFTLRFDKSTLAFSSNPINKISEFK